MASLKIELLERAKSIEDLQHKVQVQREVAVLLAQRIEVLSTKPWKMLKLPWRPCNRMSPNGASRHWHCAAMPDGFRVQERFTSILQSSEEQLLLAWQAFWMPWPVTKLAAEDGNAPSPAVPVLGR